MVIDEASIEVGFYHGFDGGLLTPCSRERLFSSLSKARRGKERRESMFSFMSLHLLVQIPKKWGLKFGPHLVSNGSIGIIKEYLAYIQDRGRP